MRACVCGGCGDLRTRWSLFVLKKRGVLSGVNKASLHRRKSTSLLGITGVRVRSLRVLRTDGGCLDRSAVGVLPLVFKASRKGHRCVCDCTGRLFVCEVSCGVLRVGGGCLARSRRAADAPGFPRAVLAWDYVLSA